MTWNPESKTVLDSLTWDDINYVIKTPGAGVESLHWICFVTVL